MTPTSPDRMHAGRGEHEENNCDILFIYMFKYNYMKLLYDYKLFLKIELIPPCTCKYNI